MEMKGYVLVFMLFLLFPAGLFAAFEYPSGKALDTSLVSQDPDPVVAGDVVEIRVGVENQGGTAANDVLVEIAPEYPFELASGFDAVKDVGTLNQYQRDDYRKIVDFKLKVDKDAPAGTYKVDVWVYQKGGRNLTSMGQSFNIEIKNRENTEIIFIDKTLLVPGEESAMKFTINNVGKSPLKDLKFKWSNDKDAVLPVGSGSTKYIRSLDVGQSVELNYRVIANTKADPGLYKLDLLLEYDDPIKGTTKQVGDVAGVYVGGGTDFDVAFSESSKGETSFNVANVGSNAAYSVSVTIPEQTGWKLRGANSVVVGNLNGGDYTIAGFRLIPLSNESKIPVAVRIIYTDTTGKRNVVEKSVFFDTANINAEAQTGQGSETKSSGAFGPESLVPALVILAGVVIYRIYTKRHNPEKKK